MEINRKSTKLPKTEMNREIIISEILRQIGVPPKLKGYEYLRSAILMTLDNSKFKHSLVKSVYGIIADENDTKVYCVERAMRNAIEVAWNRCDVETVESYFGYTVDASKGRPTNSEFITTISDIVSVEYSAFCNDEKVI